MHPRSQRCVSDLNEVPVFTQFCASVVKSALINLQSDSVSVNHLSPHSFHSQMRTSVAVLELSPRAAREDDRFLTFNLILSSVFLMFSQLAC